MQGRSTEARDVLLSLKTDEKKLRLGDKVALTATWGLLHFWENHLVAGIESYQRAETLASDSLQKDLLAIDFLAMADAKDQNHPAVVFDLVALRECECIPSFAITNDEIHH